MCSFLCFVCHSTVNMDTNEETREKYKELVGLHLKQDSHLCRICSHLLNKFWLFRSVCLKRNMEYPVLFSEKGMIYLHINDIEHFNLCCDNICQNNQRKVYHNPSYYFVDSTTDGKDDDNAHKNDFSEYFNENLDNRETVTNYNFNTDKEDIENQFNDLEKEDFNKFEYLGNYFDNVDDENGIDDSCNNNVNNSNGNIDIGNTTVLHRNCLNQVDCNNLRNDSINSSIDNTNKDRITLNDDNVDVNTDFNNDCVGLNNDCVGLNNDCVDLNNDCVDLNNDCVDLNNDCVDLNNDYVDLNNDRVDLNNDNVDFPNDNTELNIGSEVFNNETFDTHTNVYDNESGTLTITEVKNIRSDKKVKKKKRKCKGDFEKIVLTLEQQKAELERNRRQKKYIEAEFKCHNCAVGFLFKDTYQTHMMRHEESNGEYRCTTCTLRFVTPAVFRAHTSLHTDRYRCTRCAQVMRLRQCKSHAVQCGGKVPDEVASCHLCGNVFKDSNGLSQHLRRFHKLRTKNRTYSCTVCGKTYSNQAAVRTHMIKHIQRQFHCEQCPSTFSSPYMLKQHKKKHDTTPQEQHYCTTCKIGYTTRKSLLAHKRNALVHQRTVYECRICSRLCPNRFALATHTQRVHSACKQHACNVCGKRYSTRATLRRHEATHMPAIEVKMHMCHICPRIFKSRSKLNRHLREVCEKDKLEEQLSVYYSQQNAL